MENGEWRSPRKVEEDTRAYLRARFESYMSMEDRGELTRELAIAALRDEVDFTESEAA